MGTRHLIAVQLDGKYKIAQYGQWDGYPEGKGVDVLHFLRNRMDEEKFKVALRRSSFISVKALNKLWKACGMQDDGMILLTDMDTMKRHHPEFHRDTSAKILDLVQSRPNGMQLENSIGFAADGLFCEWAWVIDFDKRTFEGYRGFGSDQLTEQDRFYFLKDLEQNGYSGVKLAAEWSLDRLPTDEDFLSAFKSEDA